MAKLSVKQREDKREKLVAKYAKKYAELKSTANDAKLSDEERYAARLQLQQLPRNPTGKLLKRVLREPYWAGRDRAVS